MDQTSALGAFIRKRRQELGLSIRETGKRAGVDYSYLSRVERGEYTNLTVPTLQGIAKAIKLPYDVLIRVSNGLPPQVDDAELSPELTEVFNDVATWAPEDQERFLAVVRALRPAKPQ